MDGQTLAAWVQAIGSILAIVAAFVISFFLHRSTIKALQAQRRDANVAKLAVLFALAEKARTLIEKANTGVQDGFAGAREREFDSNDLRGLHEAFGNVVLHELPTGNTVFAVLRLKEVTRQMPFLMQQAADDRAEYGGVSPITCVDSEDLRQATNWAYMKLREECAAAEQF
jgi:hypothetical protein